MTNRESESPRSPIAIEPLESRVCLSAPMGVDVAHHLEHVSRPDAGAGERHAGTQRGHHARAAAMQPDAPRGGLQTDGEREADPVRAPMGQAVIAMPGLVLVINFWGTFAPPPPPPAMSDGPQAGGDFGEVVASPGSANGGTSAADPRVARATPTQAYVQLAQAPAAGFDAGEAAAATARNVTVVEDAVAGTGPTLASVTATTSAAQPLASSASAVIERLTSTWQDGSGAGAVDFAADAIVTEWLPAAAQTFVATAVDAATNLLAPLAADGEGVARVAAAMTPLANAAAYEIAHMGSPFALLADSLATFVEESATVTNVVAEASSRGPWALTAGVIAADVVILTYVYRRRSTRRRMQLAPVGVV